MKRKTMQVIHFRLPEKVGSYLTEQYRKNVAQFLRDAVEEKLRREETKETVDELFAATS